MAPMGVRLSPLGIGVLTLLALALVYQLYSGFLGGRFAALLLPSAAGTRTELRALLAVSLLAAQRGGEQVRRVQETGSVQTKVKGKTREGADEKLTNGDELSNRQMYFTLLNAFPDLQINSEEHIDPDGQQPMSWDGSIPDDVLKAIPEAKEVLSDSITIWIDPLDATQEYTENLQQYVTTMVCVAVDGRPIIGVVHKPFSSYTAWAMVDGGSNLKPRSTYNAAKPSIIVSRSHTGTVLEVIRQTFGNETVIIKAGGSGYKVLSLLDVPDDLQDKADVYVHNTFIKKWDICAGNALLDALGGHMTTLKGEQIQYTGSDRNEEGVLASIGMDHNILVNKLAGKIADILKKAH